MFILVFVMALLYSSFGFLQIRHLWRTRESTRKSNTNDTTPESTRKSNTNNTPDLWTRLDNVQEREREYNILSWVAKIVLPAIFTYGLSQRSNVNKKDYISSNCLNRIQF